MSKTTQKAAESTAQVTTAAVYVHRRGINPFSDVGSIRMEVEDEGGGAYLMLIDVEDESRRVAIELDELEALASVARSMVDAVNALKHTEA